MFYTKIGSLSHQFLVKCMHFYLISLFNYISEFKTLMSVLMITKMSAGKFQNLHHKIIIYSKL